MRTLVKRAHEGLDRARLDTLIGRVQRLANGDRPPEPYDADVVARLTGRELWQIARRLGYKDR